MPKNTFSNQASSARLRADEAEKRMHKAIRDNKPDSAADEALDAALLRVQAREAEDRAKAGEDPEILPKN